MNHPGATTARIPAVRKVLRPLVRLMIASGITYPVLTELLKGLFVKVALVDFPLDGKHPTDSRINLLTGLQRRDIKRLRNAGDGEESAMPESVSFGAQLVARWVGGAPFIDEEGRPRPLPRHARSGDGISFDDLVASQSKDIRARVVLDEWLRLGIVSIDDENRVVLNTDAFVPQGSVEEKIFYFAHDLHDHAAAATNNLLGTAEPRLERSVHYDRLSKESVAKLDALARQLGMNLLKTLSRAAMDLEARDEKNAAPPHRFTCGVYVYDEPAAKDAGR